MNISLPVHIHRIRKILYLNSCLMKNLTGLNPSPDQKMVNCLTPLKRRSKHTYRETVLSLDPWKGKQPRKPTRISVAMPPDDWLCQRLERLNLTVAEGYPSQTQDSAGLKRDQFIKSQNVSQGGTRCT